MQYFIRLRRGVARTTESIAFNSNFTDFLTLMFLPNRIALVAIISFIREQFDLCVRDSIVSSFSSHERLLVPLTLRTYIYSFHGYSLVASQKRSYSPRGETRFTHLSCLWIISECPLHQSLSSPPVYMCARSIDQRAMRAMFAIRPPRSNVHFNRRVSCSLRSHCFYRLTKEK